MANQELDDLRALLNQGGYGGDNPFDFERPTTVDSSHQAPEGPVLSRPFSEGASSITEGVRNVPGLGTITGEGEADGEGGGASLPGLLRTGLRARETFGDLKEGLSSAKDAFGSIGANAKRRLGRLTDPETPAAEAFGAAPSIILGGLSTAVGAIFNLAVMTPAKMLLKQETEDAISGFVNAPIDAAMKTQVAQVAMEKWNELPPVWKQALKDAGAVFEFATEIIGGPAGKSKIKNVIQQAQDAIAGVGIKIEKRIAKMKAVNEAVPSTNIQKGAAGNFNKLKPNEMTFAESRLSSIVPINPSKRAAFHKITGGQGLENWLLERGIVGNREQIMSELYDRFNASKGKVDEAFSAIPGQFKNDTTKLVFRDLLQEARDTLSTKDIAAIKNLAKGAGYKVRIAPNGLVSVTDTGKGGFTMRQLNELKRRYEREFKFGYMKDASQNAQQVKRVTNIDSELRDFQFQIAESRGFGDLKTLNQETRASRAALDGIGGKHLSSMNNNAISLTDWIVASGAVSTPKALALLGIKKAAGSEYAQRLLIKLMKPRATVGAPSADLGSIRRKGQIESVRLKVLETELLAAEKAALELATSHNARSQRNQLATEVNRKNATDAAEEAGFKQLVRDDATEELYDLLTQAQLRIERARKQMQAELDRLNELSLPAAPTGSTELVRPRSNVRPTQLPADTGRLQSIEEPFR